MIFMHGVSSIQRSLSIIQILFEIIYINFGVVVANTFNSAVYLSLTLYTYDSRKLTFFNSDR